MENREVTLPNPTILKTNSELVFPVAEKTIKIIDQDNSPSNGNVIKTEDKDIVDKNDNPKELMMNAKKIFVEKFENASVEEKQAAITQFYDVINTVYKGTYRGASIPIVFSKDGDYAFNHDGFIRIPLDVLEKQTPDKAAFSILHEYRHAIQPSLNVRSSGFGLPTFTSLSHNMLTEEIDATKFAFANMDSLGLDKTKINHYDDWQKAIRITDTFDLLRVNYNQETADNMLNIYKLLDHYIFQTTRSDFIPPGNRGKFLKILAGIKHREDKTTAKEKLTALEKVAKLNNDSFLLNVVSEIRTDWQQFHL